MCKTSVEYAELFGLRAALSDLACKKEHTAEENTVKQWLEKRIKILEAK